MAQHALFSSSGAEKWMNCAGSVAMEDGLPEQPSEYTDEGTAAHFLASTCLTEDVHPATYIGKVIDVGSSEDNDFDGAVWSTQPILAGWSLRHGFTVDTDMVAHVNTYIGNVKRAAEGGDLLVEQRLDISWLTGESGAAGTGDAIILKPDQRRLEVHDLKYGQGLAVHPENNKQLMIYALGALKQYEMLGDFDEVLLVIHQPRITHKPLEWLTTAEDLYAFGFDVTKAAKDALIAYEHRANWLPGSIAESVAYLEPSTDACQWCKAKAKCPGLAQKVIAEVSGDFVDLEEEIAPQLVDVVKRKMDLGDLANAFRAVDLIEMFCKSVRAQTFLELSNGATDPTLKLVRGKQGNRAWTDKAEAEAMLKSMKLKMEEMYDMTVISPTAVEKIFGEKGSAPSVKRWNRVNTLITRKEGSLSVAFADDPRDAVVIDKSAGFADESGDDLA